MWLALSLVGLFVGYCWYDSLKSSLLERTEWSIGSYDEGTGLARLREMLDEPLMSSPERALAQPEMGFMSSEMLTSSGEDWERTP